MRQSLIKKDTRLETAVSPVSPGGLPDEGASDDSSSWELMSEHLSLSPAVSEPDFEINRLAVRSESLEGHDTPLSRYVVGKKLSVSQTTFPPVVQSRRKSVGELPEKDG